MYCNYESLPTGVNHCLRVSYTLAAHPAGRQIFSLRYRMATISNWFPKAWLVLLVAGVIIVLDQWTKSLVRRQHSAIYIALSLSGVGGIRLL